MRTIDLVQVDLDDMPDNLDELMATLTPSVSIKNTAMVLIPKRELLCRLRSLSELAYSAYLRMISWL